MAHSNTVQFKQSTSIGLKSLFAIRDFFALLSSAWAEAKVMEQKSHKNSANW
jgi:hypothetical protein